jgi:hypothetical protein
MQLGHTAEMETIASICYLSFTNSMSFPFPVAKFTGRLPSKRVRLILCSVITIFALSRREFWIISSFLSASFYGAQPLERA